MRPQPIEIICYHCEQSAEKYLKGVLDENGIEPPRIHDLVKLCQQCSEVDETFNQLVEPCFQLTQFSVQVRYPSDDDLDDDDLTRAIDGAKMIQEFVFQVMDIEDEESYGYDLRL